MRGPYPIDTCKTLPNNIVFVLGKIGASTATPCDFSRVVQL